ncbi:MAG TPA: hypothetical protein VEK38_03490 [Candidatus Bathyarchaeia archaeon]|nr:hypothetical protein [Candidatus Bathyarchaeia archaeon]
METKDLADSWGVVDTNDPTQVTKFYVDQASSVDDPKTISADHAIKIFENINTKNLGDSDLGVSVIVPTQKYQEKKSSEGIVKKTDAEKNLYRKKIRHRKVFAHRTNNMLANLYYASKKEIMMENVSLQDLVTAHENIFKSVPEDRSTIKSLEVRFAVKITEYNDKTITPALKGSIEQICKEQDDFLTDYNRVYASLPDKRKVLTETEWLQFKEYYEILYRENRKIMTSIKNAIQKYDNEKKVQAINLVVSPMAGMLNRFGISPKIPQHVQLVEKK